MLAYVYCKFGDSCHYRHIISESNGANAKNDFNLVVENKLLRKSLDDLDHKYAMQQEVIDKISENQSKQNTLNNENIKGVIESSN